MAKNITEVPYTEIVERTIQITRAESTNDKSRIRGAANDIYCRKIPQEADFEFLIVRSSLTTDPTYNTGTVSVNTQQATCTFSSNAVLDATMTGRKIKFSTNGNIYDFTQTGTTGGTISPPLSGTQNLSSTSYVIFNPIYTLATDFDRWPKNGGLLVYQGGQTKAIPEVTAPHYYQDYQPSASIPSQCRLVNAGTDGLPHVELLPPPLTSMVLGNEYIRKLPPLRETTAGSVTIAASATTANFQQGARLGEATTGWYLRIDAFGVGDDSEWYRILSINQTTSAVTLQTAFGLSGATSAAYTLCSAPEMPSKLHQAVIWGAAALITTDQNDPHFQYYQAQYLGMVNDAKRLFKTRVYPQKVDSVYEEWQYRR